MAKKLLLILGIIVSVGIGLFVVLQNNKQTNPAELLKTEQEVYSALLVNQKNSYNDPTDVFQVIEYTNSGELQGNTPGDSAGYHLGFNENDFTDLQRKTLTDYQEKNKVSYPIKEFLSPIANVVLVNPANGKQLFWWVSFSRIGFNSSLTQALVLVGDCRGEACYDSAGVFMYSQGFYIMLEKENGEWIIKDQRDAWFIEAPSP